MKMITTRTLLKATLVGTSIALITACAATQTVMEHRSLDAKTEVSKNIFLPPVSDKEKTIYLSVKNLSDQDMDIAQKLAVAFKEKGYVVSKDPNHAHYLLQANIRKVGKMSVAASQSALGGTYGSAIAGGATGVAIGALTKNSNAMIAGGIGGGLVGMAADAMIKDVNYSMITDVQIGEKTKNGARVSEERRTPLSQGSNSSINQISSKKSEREYYQTRIVSHADKVNLAFKDARPALEAGLVKALTGIF